MSARGRSGTVGLMLSALGSLMPCAAFIAAILLADRWVDYKHVSFSGFTSSGLAFAAAYYVGFIALPSVLPLIVARRTIVWVVVLVVMTAVAAWAGVEVMTIDDAQAGLAVLWVWYVAAALAALLWIGQAIAAWRSASLRPR